MGFSFLDSLLVSKLPDLRDISLEWEWEVSSLLCLFSGSDLLELKDNSVELGWGIFPPELYFRRFCIDRNPLCSVRNLNTPGH